MAKAKAKAAKKPTKKPTKKAAPKVVVAPKVEAPKVEAPKPPEMVTVQINAKFLRSLRHIAPKEDIRYYLNAVLFSATKAGGKFYVATDGHRIGILQEPWASGEEPLDATLIIPRSVCERATPMLKSAPTAILQQVDAWTWTLKGGSDISQTFKAIDGKYPEWEKVVPDKVSGATGSYNWRYLHEFDLVVKEAFGPSAYSCSLQQNGDGAAILTSGVHSFLGLVMPLRHNGTNTPTWATEVQMANAKRKAKEKAEAEKRALEQAQAVPA